MALVNARRNAALSRDGGPHARRMRRSSAGAGASSASATTLASGWRGRAPLMAASRDRQLDWYLGDAARARPGCRTHRHGEIGVPGARVELGGSGACGRAVLAW